LSVRTATLAIALVLFGTLLAGCSERIEESAAYKATCEGPPLGNVGRREQAMSDGYYVNGQFDCIEKSSYARVQARKAAQAAWNTPEAIAKRKADREKAIAEDDARAAAEGAAEAEKRAKAPPQPAFVLRHVDINTATEAELANVPSVGPVVAAQITAARKNGRFKDWADVVHRVVGLSAAQTAAFASMSGLNVDGQSLPGAPPDPPIAAEIHARDLRNRQR
jgi:DNA uptake protein ComE-like DNA-binding protein